MNMFNLHIFTFTTFLFIDDVLVTLHFDPTGDRNSPLIRLTSTFHLHYTVDGIHADVHIELHFH